MSRDPEGFNRDHLKRVICDTNDGQRVMVTSAHDRRILEIMCLHKEADREEQCSRFNIPPHRHIPVIPYSFMELTKLRTTDYLLTKDGHEADCYTARASLLSELANSSLLTGRVEAYFNQGFKWDDGNYSLPVGQNGVYAPDMQDKVERAKKLALDMMKESGIEVIFADGALVIDPAQEGFRDKLIDSVTNYRLTVPRGLGVMHHQVIDGREVSGKLRDKCALEVLKQYDEGKIKPWRRR